MLTSVARRFARLERQRERLLATVRAVDTASQEYRPAPGAWSAADVVQHLVLVDELAARQLITPREGSRPRRIATTRLAYFVMLVVLRTPIRIKAPSKAVVPSAHVALAALESRWNAARAHLEEHLASLAPDALRRPVYRHPIAGWLTIPETLGFLEAHVAHHAAQLARIARQRRTSIAAPPA